MQMKQFFLLSLIFVSLVSYAQHSVRIFEENGKYGYSPNSDWEPLSDVLIPATYDTLFCPGGALTYDYLIGFKGNDVDIYYVDPSDPSDFGKLDTLGINHLFYLFDEVTIGLIGTNSLGDAYILEEWFEPLKNKTPIIIRGEDDLYYISKNNKRVTENGYLFIEPVSDVYACYTEEGIAFLNIKGKLLYPEMVESWDTRYREKEKIYVYKGDKRGFFMTDESASMQLTGINTPERIMHSNDYGYNFETVKLKYMAVGEEGAMGLIDEFGNEIWPKEYKQIIVTYFDEYSFRIFRKKKKTWEMLNEKLEVMQEFDFNQYLGAYGDKAFVKYKKEIVGLELEYGDTTTFDLLPEDKDYALYLSADDKVGAIDQNREEVFKAKYKGASDKYEQIIIVETDTGKIALDLTGKIVSPYSFDQIWKFELTDSAYCYLKGDYWGVFTLNNNGGFPPSPLQNGWQDFNIDVEAHGNFSNQYVIKQGKKRGIMDNTGKIIIQPTFDKIIHHNFYGGIDMYLGVIGEKFYVFTPDISDFRQINADFFIDFSEDNGYMFARGDEVLCIDPKSLHPKKYKGSNYGVQAIRKFTESYEGFAPEGVIDNEGKIIIPFAYSNLTMKIYGPKKENYILGGDREGLTTLFTTDGEVVIPPEKMSFTPICHKLPHVVYVKREKEEISFIGIWNGETKQIKRITEKEISQYKCLMSYKKELGYAAEITYEDGSKAKLTNELTIEPLEK